MAGLYLSLWVYIVYQVAIAVEEYVMLDAIPFLSLSVFTISLP